MRLNSEGDGDDLNFGFDDDGLDLNFGEDTSDTETPDINDMSAGTDEPTITDLSGQPPAAVPATPAQPAADPAATVQPATPAAPAAPTPPAQPQGQQPPTSEQPSATAPQQPVRIEEYVAQNADAIIGNLAQTHFRIDDAEAEAMGFAPEVKAWIEKRDAKNFVLHMMQMNNALQSTLPTVVANLVQASQQLAQTEELFYRDFPDLKAVPKQQLLAIGQMVRQVHPKLPKEQFLPMWVASVRQMLNLPAPNAPAPNNGQRQIRRGQPQPFMPAAAAQPQRNMGGNGAPQLSGIDYLNQMMQTDID